MRDLRSIPGRLDERSLCSLGGGAGTAAGDAALAGATLAATGLQVGYEEDALHQQEKMFQQVQANLAPYTDAGNKGTNQLLNLLGLGTMGQAGINAAVTSTPGYQFRFNQGQQSLLDATAATGGVRGGNTLKALMSYGQGQAATGYQQDLANYGSLASLGENAAAGAGNNAANFAGNIAGLTTGIGNSLSAGVTSLGQQFQQNNILNSLLNNNTANVVGAGGLGTTGNSIAQGGLDPNNLMSGYVP